MEKEQKEALMAAARRATIYSAGFAAVGSLLKYVSQYGEGYTVTVSYASIIAVSILIFLSAFLVRGAYNLYHSPPPHRRYSTD